MPASYPAINLERPGGDNLIDRDDRDQIRGGSGGKYHDMGRGDGRRSLLLCLGSTRSTDRLNNKGDDVEARENHNVPCRSQWGIFPTDEDGPWG
jgi:hypothetical protein